MPIKLRNPFYRAPKGVSVSETTPLRRQLTDAEVKHLRAWMSDPMTKLAFRVVASKQPSVLVPNIGNAQDIVQRESAKLNQLLGWQMCFTTFLDFLDEPGKPKEQLVETYDQE